MCTCLETLSAHTDSCALRLGGPSRQAVMMLVPTSWNPSPLLDCCCWGSGSSSSSNSPSCNAKCWEPGSSGCRGVHQKGSVGRWKAARWGGPRHDNGSLPVGLPTTKACKCALGTVAEAVGLAALCSNGCATAAWIARCSTGCGSAWISRSHCCC